MGLRTVALELLDQQPDINAIIAPVGGGGLISGICVAASAINPRVRVFAAEPAGAATNLHGFAKEHGAGIVTGLHLELVAKDGSTIARAVSGEDGSFAFDRRFEKGMRLVSQPYPGKALRLAHAVQPVSPVAIWVPPMATIEGVVVDAAGQPVAGARVATDRYWMPLGMTPYDVIAGELPKNSFDLRTDEAGHFVIVNAQQGRHRVRVTHGNETGSLRCRAGDHGLVIRLGGHGDSVVVLEGRLTERLTGEPIAGARVHVSRVRRSPSGYSSVGVASGTTDEQGRYEVQGLDANTYALSTMPDGYARAESGEHRYEAGRHTVDLLLDPARELLVEVVQPNGAVPTGVELQVFDADGQRVEVPGRMRIMGAKLPLGRNGKVRVRRLPTVPLTLKAIRGDLHAAGEIEVDLARNPPESVTIVMPTDGVKFARSHYFKLLGPDGEPAQIDGTVVAECHDGAALLSRVEGRWRDGKFWFGHEERSGRSVPTIGVGAAAGPCRVEITVPGYRRETLTLEPGAKSPTDVTLRR